MEAVIYKCPNCGGELTFKPETQDFGCDFCLSRFTEEEIKKSCAKAENSIPDKEQQDFSGAHESLSLRKLRSGNNVRR